MGHSLAYAHAHCTRHTVPRTAQRRKTRKYTREKRRRRVARFLFTFVKRQCHPCWLALAAQNGMDWEELVVSASNLASKTGDVCAAAVGKNASAVQKAIYDVLDVVKDLESPISDGQQAAMAESAQAAKPKKRAGATKSTPRKGKALKMAAATTRTTKSTASTIGRATLTDSANEVCSLMFPFAVYSGMAVDVAFCYSSDLRSAAGPSAMARTGSNCTQRCTTRCACEVRTGLRLSSWHRRGITMCALTRG